MRPRPLFSAASCLTILSALGPTASAPAQIPGQAPGDQRTGLVGRTSPLQVVEPSADDRDLRTTPVVRAVQRAADSVVSIYLKHQRATRDEVTDGQGSGVILDENGLVITNWHVVAPVVLGGGAEGMFVEIKLRDGRTRRAGVLSSTPKRDLALLQLELENGEKVKPMEIGRYADLMIGETVVAIGNPQGHANTVTSGVLSAIDRSIVVRAPDGERRYAGLLQTDAAINQGNSGGALLDITGRLIGINNAMAMGAENIGFAIPIDTVREQFETELIQSGSFAGAAAWLGLEVADRDGTVIVDQVAAGGPAQKAGVHVGDVLARIGDVAVASSIDYLRRVYDARADQPLPLTLTRAGREVKVAPVPITRKQWVLQNAIGATAQQIDLEDDPALVRKVTMAFYESSQVRRRVPPFPAIVRLQNLEEDGPAHAIGLRPGDIVLSVFVRQQAMFGGFVDRELPVTSLHDFATLLRQYRGQSLRLAVLRGDEALVGTIEVRKTTL